MNLKKLKNLDWYLITAVMLLCIIGVISIGSATHINLGESTSTYYSQILWISIGFFIMLFVSIVSLDFFSKFYIPIYIFNILLLVAVLLFGHSAKGATRWLYFGPIGIQPSEFSKIMMIFCMAKIIDKNSQKINNKLIILLLCVLTAVPIILIQKQPSLSASMVLLAIVAVQLFVGGISYKYISLAIIIVVPLLFFIGFDILKEDPLIVDKVFRPHQISRILTFLRPEANDDSYYQTMKSISAIGSGRITGKGLYQGTLNQLSYLPEPYNDFIFSVIGEEFGFVGCMVVLVLEFFIVFRCIVIAMNARSNFYQLCVVGVAGMIAFQTFVNTGVATGILPNTGMSLPFVSYGGSSMWTNMASIGLVLNVHMMRSKSIFAEV